VSSSTVTKHKVIGHGAPAARLIPGASLLPNALLRKKPQSVSVDGRYWTETESPSPQPDPNAFQLLAQAVLPAPAMRGQRRRLAGLVCADFMCLSFTFMVVSNFRMLATAIFRQPSSSWTFPAAGLGFVFLQGAMLTLLAYSEGLYRAELMWSPEEQRVVLGKVASARHVSFGIKVHLTRRTRVERTPELRNHGWLPGMAETGLDSNMWSHREKRIDSRRRETCARTRCLL